jgi:nickel transport protein
MRTLPLGRAALTRDTRDRVWKYRRTWWLRCGLAIYFFLHAGLLAAHDVTLFPSVDGHRITLNIKYGDPGGYEPAVAQKLLDLDAYAPDGMKTSFRYGVQVEGIGLTTIQDDMEPPLSGTWLFASRYDNGFYVHTVDGHAFATTKLDFPAARDSAHYFKFSKSLLRVGRSSGVADRIVGHRLELVPHADPFSLPPGERMPVEVIFDGKPLVGVAVEIGDDAAAAREPKQKTDDKGVVFVPIQRAGWYRIAVDHRVPSAYTELFTDDDYTATLTFFLPH